MRNVQRISTILFIMNGLAFSIYYYIQTPNDANFAYFIFSVFITSLLIFIYIKKIEQQYIFNLILLNCSFYWQIIFNERNIQDNGVALVIVNQLITTQIFNDQKKQHQQIQHWRLKFILFVVLVQSILFQIAYISSTFEYLETFYQGIMHMIISILINYLRGIQNKIKTKKKQSDSIQNINSEQFIMKKDRVSSSQAESEKISPKSRNSPCYHSQKEELPLIGYLNSSILEVIMQYTQEGLIVLKEKQNNQDIEILYSNIAAKSIFSCNSSKEIISILNSFTNLKYIYQESPEEYLLNFNNQKQLCKSVAILKSDQINQSAHPNFLFLMETHSDKFSINQFQKIFSKFQNNNFNESFVIHTFYPKQSVSLSQMEKKPEKVLELTITRRDQNLYFLIIRDITHKQKIRYLREYDLQKSKMLSYVSHEYRSPLNCIIQMIENVLQSQQLNTDCNEMLQAALDNSNYILNLSNDLLDLAQIKNGKFTIQMSKFNCEQLIKECLTLFTLKARIMKLNLTYEYDSQAPKILVSDKNRVKQILVNLLSNGFKFAATEIKIIVSCIETTTIRIGVHDDGIGISDEDQKKLFRSFSKVNSEESRKRNEYGVGLGLVISNQIAGSIGCGGLQIESKLHQGTHFFFDLQIQSPRLRKVPSLKIKENSGQEQEVDETIAFPQQVVDDLEPPLHCQHILVVDDEIFNVFTFTKLLNKKNINDIDSANNGNECIEKVRQKKCCDFCTGYRIIFMDLEMPILNGLNATKTLLQANPKQIIIACSGYTDHHEKDQCYKIGMQDYLVKPIRDQELSFILKTYYF